MVVFGKWLCGCVRVWWWSCGCGGLTHRWQQGLAQRWPFGGLCWLRTTDGCKPVARPRRLLPRSVARSSQSLPLAAHLLREGGGGAKSRLVGTDGACRQLRRLRTSQGVVPWCGGCWHLGCGRSTRTRQKEAAGGRVGGGHVQPGLNRLTSAVGGVPLGHVLLFGDPLVGASAPRSGGPVSQVVVAGVY